ncbi:glycohydrolase toxin TNT-related protein [Actinoalloteichus caeruleus]|uniref:glycohydrolase toxin TNT-related protein n=2 Tax=Actinoalloteichus cyanogriseus TaxID=2893586 RepID=UPI0004BE4EA4|nr:TNT domain-containing protein [Actinoalloteichus caeruleus]
MSRPTANSPEDQAALARKIGVAVLGAAPPGWQRIRVEYRAAGQRAETVGEVVGPDGESQGWEPPAECAPLFDQLRHGMYRPGVGTWLSAFYVVERPSNYRIDVNLNQEPGWDPPLPDAVYREELQRFPRAEEHIPDWLRQRLGTSSRPSGEDAPRRGVPQLGDPTQAAELVREDATDLLPGSVVEELRSYTMDGGQAAPRAEEQHQNNGFGGPPNNGYQHENNGYQHGRRAESAQEPDRPGDAAGDGGFSVARVFDGTREDGRPMINRAAVDPADREVLLAYLDHAPVVLDTRNPTPDPFGADGRATVPASWHTDGRWIWSAAVGYHLRRHGVPPVPELVDHVRSQRFELPPVGEDVLAAAAALLHQRMPETRAAAQREQQPVPDFPLGHGGGFRDDLQDAATGILPAATDPSGPEGHDGPGQRPSTPEGARQQHERIEDQPVEAPAESGGYYSEFDEEPAYRDPGYPDERYGQRYEETPGFPEQSYQDQQPFPEQSYQDPVHHQPAEDHDPSPRPDDQAGYQDGSGADAFQEQPGFDGGQPYQDPGGYEHQHDYERDHGSEPFRDDRHYDADGLDDEAEAAAIEDEASIEQLRQRLSDLGVDPEGFRVGVVEEDVWCLLREDVAGEEETWSVFWSEHGERYDEVHFGQVNQACAYLLGALLMAHPHDHEEPPRPVVQDTVGEPDDRRAHHGDEDFRRDQHEEAEEPPRNLPDPFAGGGVAIPPASGGDPFEEGPHRFDYDPQDGPPMLDLGIGGGPRQIRLPLNQSQRGEEAPSRDLPPDPEPGPEQREEVPAGHWQDDPEDSDPARQVTSALSVPPPAPQRPTPPVEHPDGAHDPGQREPSAPQHDTVGGGHEAAGQPPRRQAADAQPSAARQQAVRGQGSEQQSIIRPLKGEPPLTLFRERRLLMLQAGTEIDRFGEPDGNVSYSAGTPYEQRSLPPQWVNRSYRAYRLLRPLQVLTGVAVPWFEQPGGGLVYILPRSITDLVDDGALAEVPEAAPPA